MKRCHYHCVPIGGTARFLFIHFENIFIKSFLDGGGAVIIIIIGPTEFPGFLTIPPHSLVPKVNYCT